MCGWFEREPYRLTTLSSMSQSSYSITFTRVGGPNSRPNPRCSELKPRSSYKGPFINYVRMLLAIFDPPPTPI